MHARIITITLSLLAIFGLAGCVTAIDGALPYAELPQITLATEVKLIASPAHPSAYLAAEPLAAGANVQVVGVDTDAAWLLVLADDRLGWMPTFFSRTNVGSLKAAIVVEPLDESCTQYLGETTDPAKLWVSTTAGGAIIQGSLYRAQPADAFTDATLTLTVDGGGSVTAAEYIHTLLTPTSAVVLFTFVVADLTPESRLHFDLANGGDEPISFQAALFSHQCANLNTSGVAFTDQLPIGQTRLLDTASQPQRNPGTSELSPSQPLTTTSAAESSGPTTTVTPIDAQAKPQGEILLAILSTRAGPSFDYPATAAKLQGDSFAILARVCGGAGSYEWYMVAREDGTEHWLPGPAAFVTVTNAETLICLPPPPPPTPAESSVKVLVGTDAVAEISTDPAAFAPYLAAIGHYRLAEKAALALPNSPAIRQLADYAQGAALVAGQDHIRQLRSRRLSTALSIEQLEIKLVVTFNDGTASVVAHEVQTQTTQRITDVGRETVADVAYSGAILYTMRYHSGQWQLYDVVPLGASGGMEVVTTGTDIPAQPAIDDEGLERLRTLLAAKDAHAVVGPTSAPTIDATAFTQPASTTLTGRISANTVLNPVGGPYVMQGEVTVDAGVTLLIEPGAIVKFMDDAYLYVDGALIAQGTQDQPIIFTSIKDDLAGGDTNADGGATAPAPGDWTYIRFRDASNDINSIIEQAIIRYAGEYRGESYAAIHLAAASPTLVNNVLEDNFGYAISGDVASFPFVSGNHLAHNGGNGFLVIEGQLTTSGVWRTLDMPYVLFRPMTIQEGATLTLEPGVMVKLADDAYIDVYGAFKATGTVDDPVTFTSLKDDAVGGDTNGDEVSTAPAAGDWTMIRFYNASNDANSLIDHAVVRYAGEHRGTAFGAIHLEAAAPTLTNNTIEDSFGYAISGDVHAFPIMSGNTLQRNVGNGFEVRAGNMATSGVWRNTDIAYTVPGIVTINDGTTLSIEPGVIVKLSNDAYFDVYGAFRALGTAETPITFTSLRDDTIGGDTNGDQNSSAPSAGDWTMIRFRDSSNDANSIVEHAIIRYGGENRNTPFGAIYLEAASPMLTDNTFSANFWYAMSADVHSFPTVSGNELLRNVGNGLEIRSGTMTTSGAWHNTDIVYTLLAPLTVNEGAILTIDPGVMVKLAGDAYVDVNGALRATGAADNPIIFTSLRDDSVGGDTNGDQSASAPAAGDWTYIGFKDKSNDTNSMVDYAVIRYAGKWRGEPYGAIYLEAASPVITNNTIEHSFGYAVSGDVHSFPTVSGNQIANNAGNGLLIRAGAMTTGGIWRNTDIAYTVLGIVAVNEGTLLTIDPGVVVKLGDDAHLKIMGAFKAIGTQAAPITFTSVRDDIVAGDTNGDGASTVPTAGDWTYIGFFDSSNDVNSRVEYATIRYAGEWRGEPYGALHLEGASPTLVNNTIEDSFAYGIWHDANSSPQLENNTFNNNAAGDVVAAE